MRRKEKLFLIVLAIVLAIGITATFLTPMQSATSGGSFIRLAGGTDDGYDFGSDTTTRKKVVAVFFDGPAASIETGADTTMTFDGVVVYSFELDNDQRDCFCPPSPVTVRNFEMTNLQTNAAATIVLGN